MSGELKIGELASAADVSRDTIRYYERLGLLPCASRSRSGYRLYTDSDAERVRFIRQAQALGLSLEEIKILLPGRETGLAECRQVRDLLKSKLEDMDARMAEMRAFRLRLAAYLEECEEALADGRRDRCPVLFDISLSSVHEANPSSRLFTSAKKTSRKKRRKKDER